MSYHGDFMKGDTVRIPFTTVDTDGVPTALTSGAAVVYPLDSTTEVTDAETLTADFDSVTGLNVIAIATSGLSRFKDYAVVLSAGTVDGNSVVGYIVGTFSIENRFTPGLLWRGLMQAGGDTTTVKLGSGSSFGADGLPDGAVIQSVGGTGAWQTRFGHGYDESEDEFTVSPALDTAFDSDTEGFVFAGPPAPTDATLLPPVKLGAIGSEAISDQAGENFETFFNNGASATTVVVDDAASAGASAADIADAVLDEAMSGHTTPGTLGAAIADIDTATGNTDDAVGAMDVVVGGIAADLATVDGKIDTIDGKVDDILEDTGTTGVKVDDSTPIEANVKAINDVTLEGDGTTGTPWGPSS